MRSVRDLIIFSLIIYGGLVANESSAAKKNETTIKAKIPDTALELQILAKPEIAEFLVNRTYKRPENCPLRVLKHQDLQDKLLSVANALRYGECYNRNQAVVNGLDDILKQSATFEKAALTQGVGFGGAGGVGGIGTVGGAGIPQLPSQPNSGDRQAILSSLEKVSVDEACVNNIRKRGLLPVVADIATNIGQMSLFIPSPNGFLLGIGALGVGATLKIIWGLLKSPFDWELASDREQFLDLNCSFFDLRRDIEAAEILEPVEVNLDSKIGRVKKAEKLVQTKIIEIHQRQAILNEEIDALGQAYVLKKESVVRFDLVRHIERFLTAASGDTSDLGETRKFTAVNLLMEHASSLILQIESLGERPLYWKYLRGILAEFTWKNLAAVNAIAEDDFFADYHKPIILYLNEYVIYLKEYEKKLQLRFDGFTETSSRLTVAAYQKQADNNYADILTGLLEALGRIEIRRHVLESKINKKSFDASDDSAHGTFSILQEYKIVQDILFEKLGYSFLDYFRKVLKHDKKYFLKGYRDFSKNNSSPVSPRRVRWACRDANQLRLMWESANSAAEVAYDFIETNRGIFYSQVKYLRTFLFFIPVGRTKQYLMYRHVRGAEEIVDALAAGRRIDWDHLKKWGRRKHHNLGWLMAEVKQSEGMRLDVETFLDLNNCPNYL